MEVQQLIIDGLKGKQSALRAIYDLYVDEMYSSSFRITNDESMTQDIIQESFITSFEKLKKLENKANYQGWLRRIVINNSLKAIKKKVTFKQIEDNHLREEDETNWYNDITFEQIKSGIQKLPIGARTVFSLYALEGYTHAEIADLNNISISTSKTQYRYARINLKDILTKMYVNEI